MLLQKGYDVCALVRPGSEKKLPKGCRVCPGDALDGNSFKDKIPPCETFIQLIGTPHPGPGKKKQFEQIDLVSVRESVKVSKASGVKHFIYLSVAEPAPVMDDYIKIRKQGEEMIRNSGMNATFLKPWYVLGPGHYWPYILLPFYKIFELIPGTRKTALRLAPVSIKTMVNSIIFAVENPPIGIRILEAEQIKKNNT